MERPGRNRRRADLLRPDHTALRPRPLVGTAGRVGRRTRDLGRRRARSAGGGVARSTTRSAAGSLHGRRRAGDPGGPGGGPDRQLLQPGAVRRPDRPAVGACDLAGPPTGRLRALLDLPPDIPLRADLRPRARGRAGLARPPSAHPSAGPVRPVRDRLLGVPDLRGDAARRSGHAPARPAPQPVRRLGTDGGGSGVVRAHAAARPGPDDAEPGPVDARSRRATPRRARGRRPAAPIPRP